MESDGLQCLLRNFFKKTEKVFKKLKIEPDKNLHNVRKKIIAVLVTSGLNISPDIGKRVVSNESYFTMDRVVWGEVKKNYKLPTS